MDPAPILRYLADIAAIDVVRVPPGATTELDAALAEVARQAASGRTDIAIVSPFRALADAAQAELLAAYQVEDVVRSDRGVPRPR